MSIQGTHDGEVLKIFDDIRIDSPKKAIMTFLEYPTEDFNAGELHLIAQQGGAFDFLNKKEENIYTDNDLKIKY